MNDESIRRETLCIDSLHPSLPGHFPGNPVVPGVMLLDCVQTAIEGRHGAGRVIRLPQVKFLRPLLPGESAEIALDDPAPIATDGDHAGSDHPYRIRFRIERDDALLASGEFVMAQADRNPVMANPDE